MLCEIKGTYYRPPAQSICKYLPVNTPLTIRHDPWGEIMGSPHNDAFALAVILRGEDLPIDYDLDDDLARYGKNLGEMRETEEIHLGYIPKEIAATIRTDDDMTGRFALDGRNRPHIEF